MFVIDTIHTSNFQMKRVAAIDHTIAQARIPNARIVGPPTAPDIRQED
jgi:hypothetical protein